MNTKETTAQILKQNIRRLRTLNELSMRQVATMLGVKENTYRVWEDESGSCPKPHYIVELARIYKVPTDALLLKEPSAVSTATAVHSTQQPYNPVYGDRYLTELSNSEKLLVMSVRRLNSQDKRQVTELIAQLLENNETHY